LKSDLESYIIKKLNLQGDYGENKTMKSRMLILLTLALFLLLLMADWSFCQRDFHMAERKLVDKFKMADAKFQKGKGLFFKEKYDRAEKELRACLEIMPEHADASFFLSQIDYKKGDFEQALAGIEKAKSNYEFIGQLYTFTHQERLEALRDEKFKLENEVITLQNEISRITGEEDRQKVQLSIDRIKNNISIIDSRLNEPIPPVLEIPADYYYFHGNVCFKLKKFEEAGDQYLEAINIEPQHVSAYNNLISLYYMAKNYEQALKYIHQAEASGVKLNPELKKAVLKALGK
jgi:pentatricopeptide repeat protein